jgi:subtilisin-like proprotein convertase family protein
MRSRLWLSVFLGALAASLSFAAGAGAVTYGNPSAITIRDNAIALPYPSPITVAGMSGDITDLTVTARGLSHTFLDDVGIVLVAPTGENLMLIDGVGPNTNPAPNAGVSNVDLTFDDAAASQLADAVVPTTGSFRPANYYPQSGAVLDNFPAPGPGNTYANPGPAVGGTATMVQPSTGAFLGIEANGTWRLFVRDFSGQDQGQIARGWALDVDTTGGGGDFTAPDTTITSGPSGVITQGAATFTFTSDEDGTFECAFDGQPFAACATPKAYSNLSDGAHTFAVRAVDSASLVDPTPDSRSFTVDVPDPPPPPPPDPPDPPAADTTAPVVTITKLTVNKKRTAKITFSGTDDVTPPSGLGFTCKLDGKAPAPCTSPVAYKKLKPGRHRIEVRASDAAANESAPAIQSFKVKKRKRA